jgi:hypothetical protein
VPGRNSGKVGITPTTVMGPESRPRAHHFPLSKDQ